MTCRYSIYTYTCPVSGEVFYVGQDRQNGYRGQAVRGHVHGAVQHKIKKLLASNLRPIITIVCQFDTQVDVEELNRAEVYWVTEGRRLGWPLLNLTKGGKGTSGWRCYDEARTKISAANRGKKRTQEQRERIAAAHRGRTISKETRQKMSEAQKGRKFSEAHKRALRESWYEHHGPESIERNAAAKRGRPRDVTTRQKLSEALKGKPWSEARRAAYENRRQERD